MPQYDNDPYTPRRNDSGTALWVGIAMLMILIVGGFMLIGPHGQDGAESVIASQKSGEW